MLWINGYILNSSKHTIYYEFLGWFLVLVEKDGRKIGWISDFSDIAQLFKFMWIISSANNSKIFTVGSSLCASILCKFLWILEMYFMHYEFLIETDLVCGVKI